VREAVLKASQMWSVEFAMFSKEAGGGDTLSPRSAGCALATVPMAGGEAGRAPAAGRRWLLLGW